MNTTMQIFRKIDPAKIDFERILSRKTDIDVEIALLTRIKNALDYGNVETFWVPTVNPSLDAETKQIVFKEGAEPCAMATKLWNAQAELYLPERGSRMATSYERTIYTAYIIDRLMYEDEYSEADAWEIVRTNNRKALEKYEDTSMLKITYTEGRYELWHLTIKLMVDYQFNYCDKAAGLVVLTKA